MNGRVIAELILHLGRIPCRRLRVSGVSQVQRGAPGTASLAVLQPWVDHIIDSFGPARVLWGGDWPVVNLGAGLPGWIAMTRALLAGLSEAKRGQIGSGTARRVYGLG